MSIALCSGDWKYHVGLNQRNINELDEQGWSALSYAAYFGYIDTCRGLITIGCDPTASTTAHPYSVAYCKNQTSVLQLLVPYWNKGSPPMVDYVPAIETKGTSVGQTEYMTCATLATIRSIAGHWKQGFTRMGEIVRLRRPSTFEDESDSE
jgi:ankyrin repeat protein